MSHDFKLFPELTNDQLDMYYFESPHKQITSDFVAKVTKVHDGDTIRVKWKERDFDFPVRLLDIDAPEMNQLGGERSQSWLESMILDKEVDIIINPKHRVEKWGRLLGKVMFFGMDINELSITEGMSVPFARREEKYALTTPTEITFDTR